MSRPVTGLGLAMAAWRLAASIDQLAGELAELTPAELAPYWSQLRALDAELAQLLGAVTGRSAADV